MFRMPNKLRYVQLNALASTESLLGALLHIDVYPDIRKQ